jgi:hypothetical protein
MTLYRVRFVYCVNVDAESPRDAHKSVSKQIKEHPQSVISSIEDVRYAHHRPVWKLLLFGR